MILGEVYISDLQTRERAATFLVCCAAGAGTAVFGWPGQRARWRIMLVVLDMNRCCWPHCWQTTARPPLTFSNWDQTCQPTCNTNAILGC